MQNHMKTQLHQTVMARQSTAALSKQPSTIAAAGSVADSSKAMRIADNLFGNLPPSPERQVTPSYYDNKLLPYVVSNSFLPEHAAAQASALPLDAGLAVRCTAEEWRLVRVEQKGWAFVPSHDLEKAPVSAQDARHRVALELLETEESYGKALRLIRDTLMTPLSQAAILPPHMIAKIFSCCDRISELSDTMSEQLRSRLEEWDAPTSTVSDVFKEHMAKNGILGGSRLGDLYVQYVNNYEQSTRAIAAATELEEWRYFIKHWTLLTEATGNGKHQLGALLIQPVQRIPRYKLLLEQLLKETPKEHPDHVTLLSTLEEISAVATKVNTAIKRREAVEAVFELQDEFGGGSKLALPGRLLVKRLDQTPCKLSVSGERLDETSKKLTLVLFSDALLLAEKGFSGKLSIYSWWYPDKLDRDRDNAQIIRLRQASADCIETLSFAPPSAEYDAWREELDRLVKELKQGGGATMSFARGAPSSFARGGGHGSPRNWSFMSGGATAVAPHEQVGASALFAGWLEKKGGGGADGSSRNWAKGGRRNWKKRWVVVSSNQFLSWYDHGPNPKSKDLKGSLALHGAQVTASERPGGFWILTNSRSLELTAESKEAAERWIAIIQESANQVASCRMRASTDKGAAAGMSIATASATSEPGAEEDSYMAPPPPPPPRPRMMSNKSPAQPARALFDYEALNDGELSLTAGEVFDVLRTDTEAEGWWFGLMGEEFGYFPANYVQLLEECESLPSTPLATPTPSVRGGFEEPPPSGLPGVEFAD